VSVHGPVSELPSTAWVSPTENGLVAWPGSALSGVIIDDLEKPKMLIPVGYDA